MKTTLVIGLTLILSACGSHQESFITPANNGAQSSDLQSGGESFSLTSCFVPDTGRMIYNNGKIYICSGLAWAPLNVAPKTLVSCGSEVLEFTLAYQFVTTSDNSAVVWASVNHKGVVASNVAQYASTQAEAANGWLQVALDVYDNEKAPVAGGHWDYTYNAGTSKLTVNYVDSDYTNTKDWSLNCTSQSL